MRRHALFLIDNNNAADSIQSSVWPCEGLSGVDADGVALHEIRGRHWIGQHDADSAIP